MKHTFIKIISLISSIAIIGLTSTFAFFSTQTASASSVSYDNTSKILQPATTLMIPGPDGGTSTTHEEYRNGQGGTVYHISMHFLPNEVITIKHNFDMAHNLGNIINMVPLRYASAVSGALWLMSSGYYANYFNQAYYEGRGLHWEYNIWIPYSSYYAAQITNEQIYTE